MNKCPRHDKGGQGYREKIGLSIRGNMALSLMRNALIYLEKKQVSYADDRVSNYVQRIGWLNYAQYLKLFTHSFSTTAPNNLDLYNLDWLPGCA